MLSPLGAVEDEGSVASVAVEFVFVFVGVGCGVYFVAVCFEIAEVDVECWMFVVACV